MQVIAHSLLVIPAERKGTPQQYAWSKKSAMERLRPRKDMTHIGDVKERGMSVIGPSISLDCIRRKKELKTPMM